MLALVLTSVPPSWNGSRSASLQAIGQSQRHRLRRRSLDQDRELVAAQARRRCRLGRTWRTMRCAAATRNWSPALWPSVSLISLKRSKSRYITANARVGSRAAALDAVQAVAKARAVGQAGQVVVIGDVVQPRFGRAARGDVLRLQDQPRRRDRAVGEGAGVDRDPHLLARRAVDAQFDRRCVVARAQRVRRAARGRRRRRVHDGAQFRAHQVALAAPHQRQHRRWPAAPGRSPTPAPCRSPRWRTRCGSAAR